MRKELHDIESIENYLSGNLSTEEIHAFEQKLISDPNFAVEVEMQEQLSKRVQRVSLRQELDIIHNEVVGNAGSRGRYWKGWILGTIGLLVGLSVLFGLLHKDDVKPHNETSFTPSAVIADSSTVEQPEIYTNEDLKESDDNIVLLDVKKEVVPIVENPIEKVEITPDTSLVTKKKSNIPVLKPFNEDALGNVEDQIQRFVINPTRDTVLTGIGGLQIAIPKGALINSKGELGKDDVIVEVVEALDVKSMLLSNLTTISNNYLFRTDGVFYISATQNGEQINVSNEKPIYVEIPTETRKSNVQILEGSKNEYGEVDWENPRGLDNYLVSFDINHLDFYPEGFHDVLQKNSVFGKNNLLSNAATDEIYYGVECNTRLAKKFNKSLSDDLSPVAQSNVCGIDPTLVKALKNKFNQETVISTREFQQRARALYNTCSGNLVRHYIENSEKPLWELDNEIAKKLKYTMPEQSAAFSQFAKEMVTTLDEGGMYAKMLSSYYNNELNRIDGELLALQQLYYKKKSKSSTEKAKYHALFKNLQEQKRKHLGPSYGTRIYSFGWKSISQIKPVAWSRSIFRSNNQSFYSIKFKGDETYDKSYAYMIFPNLRSIAPLYLVGKNQFAYKNLAAGLDKKPKVFVIAFKDGKMYTAENTEVDNEAQTIWITLKEANDENLKRVVSIYEFNKPEQHSYYSLSSNGPDKNDKQDQKKLTEELRRVIYPCHYEEDEINVLRK